MSVASGRLILMHTPAGFWIAALLFVLIGFWGGSRDRSRGEGYVPLGADPGGAVLGHHDIGGCVRDEPGTRSTLALTSGHSSASGHGSTSRRVDGRDGALTRASVRMSGTGLLVAWLLHLGMIDATAGQAGPRNSDTRGRRGCEQDCESSYRIALPNLETQSCGTSQRRPSRHRLAR